MMTAKTWQELVADKRSRQKDTIPKEWLLPISPADLDHIDAISFPESEKCGLLTPSDIEITNTPVSGLLEKLASGTWTSVDVTRSFAKRAIIAHQLTNCLTEIFIDKALERAAHLDEHLKKTGKVVGPLHGLPISLKDQLCIEGLETTMGYVSWIGQYATQNAVLVDILLNAGAVLYVRTNIPQTLMWPETFNNVFGRTVNPYNRKLTPGGSSGGEGALIALKGSPLGVGSDVGGSIRIPSSFCGIYGLRPSYGRVPYAKALNSQEGQDSVPSVFGPISDSLEGVKIFMKAIVAEKPWLKDPLAIRKPWNDEEYNLVDHGQGKKLCFGIIWHDNVVLPNPPVLRGLEMTKKALLAAGHQVIDWNPEKHDELYDTVVKIWGSGAAEDYRVTTASTGEPIITTMSPDGTVTRKSSFRPGDEVVSAYQLWQFNRKKRELRQEYLDRWNATIDITGTGRPVDALISPVAPYAAPLHGNNKSADYTMVFNVLDYPAISIPVTKVDQQLDQKKEPHPFYSEKDRENYELYDSKIFENAPVGIQVVGRTLEEEALLAMAEIVDKALKERLEAPTV